MQPSCCVLYSSAASAELGILLIFQTISECHLTETKWKGFMGNQSCTLLQEAQSVGLYWAALKNKIQLKKNSPSSRRVGKECKQVPMCGDTAAAWNFWTAREASSGWEGTHGPHQAISALGFMGFEYWSACSPISAGCPGGRLELTASPPVVNWTLLLSPSAVVSHYCPWLLLGGAGTVGTDQPTGRGPKGSSSLPLPVSDSAWIEAESVSHPVLFLLY